jgi:hypothetical protein
VRAALDGWFKNIPLDGRRQLQFRRLKFRTPVPIDGDMSVSSVTGSNSGGVTGQAALDHATAAMKKIHDIRQNEAQALVQLISQASEAAQAPAGGGGIGSIISYYA